MPACPVCRDEFEDDVEVCPTDGVPLVPADQLPPPPVGEATLGLFHPLAAAPVVRFLEHRDVPYSVTEVDDVRTELRVPEPVRDPLRAELTVGWTGFLRGVDPEQAEQLATTGGPQPGWWDAPQGAWVDRDGRLRVEASPEEQDVEDASRTVGPALAAAGVVVLLLGWFNGWSEGAMVLGAGAVLLGVLLPR